MGEMIEPNESVRSQPQHEAKPSVYAELEAGMQKGREDMEKARQGEDLIEVDFAERDIMFQAFQKRSHEVGKKLEDAPYTIKAKINGREIYLLGMHHNTDPASPPLVGEQEQFDEFIRTAKKPTVMIEGGVRAEYNYDGSSRAQQRDSAITTYGGEKGLAIFLAQESDLPLSSPEPSNDKLIQSLEQYFSREEIMDDIFAGSLVQYARDAKFDPNIAPFDEFCPRYIAVRLDNPVGWEQEDVNVDKYYQRFIEKNTAVLGEQPSIEQITKVAQVSVMPRNSEVSKTSGYMRDKYIFDQITKSAQAGQDVFLVFGSYHVFMYEQMLLQQGAIEKEPQLTPTSRIKPNIPN